MAFKGLIFIKDTGNVLQNVLALPKIFKRCSLYGTPSKGLLFKDDHQSIFYRTPSKGIFYIRNPRWAFPRKKAFEKSDLCRRSLYKIPSEDLLPTEAFREVFSLWVKEIRKIVSLYGRAFKGLLSVENISRIFYICWRPPNDFLSKKALSKKTTQRCSIYRWNHKDFPSVEKLPRLLSMNDPLSIEDILKVFYFKMTPQSSYIHRRPSQGLQSIEKPKKAHRSSIHYIKKTSIGLPSIASLLCRENVLKISL